MAQQIPNIVVIGERIPEPFSQRSPFSGASGERVRGRPPRERGPPPGPPAEPPIPEIVVTAKKPPTYPASIFFGLGAAWQGTEASLLTRNIPTAFERLLQQQTPSAFERLLQQPVRKRVMEEIVVKAPKPSPLLTGLQRLNIFATLSSVLGTLGAEVARDISQARLEREYGWLMAEQHLRRPDSPLQTIAEPAPIPEIVVKGRRPAPSIEWARFPWSPFAFDFSLPFEAYRPQTQTEFELAPPQVERPTRTLPPGQPLAGPIPWAQPFGEPPTIRPDLTRFQEPALPSPRTRTQPRTQTDAIREGYCPPAPECTKEDEPDRTECWRKLVKEHRRPEMDKEYKWERIDCDTGRPLPNILNLIRNI